MFLENQVFNDKGGFAYIIADHVRNCEAGSKIIEIIITVYLCKVSEYIFEAKFQLGIQDIHEVF